MSELAQELIDLQAVCERLGVDDDDVLNRAADRITELETQLEAVRGLGAESVTYVDKKTRLRITRMMVDYESIKAAIREVKT